MELCKLCTLKKEWSDDQNKYDETGNPEYDYTCPCVYCQLNEIDY